MVPPSLASFLPITSSFSLSLSLTHIYVRVCVFIYAHLVHALMYIYSLSLIFVFCCFFFVFVEETYCDVLMKYKCDLSRPFDEATAFLNDVQLQLSHLSYSPASVPTLSGQYIYIYFFLIKVYIYIYIYIYFFCCIIYSEIN